MSTSGIGGEKREQTNFGERKVGLFEAKVIAVNPSAEDYKEILGITLKDDSKATEYLGTSSEGNTFLRVDVWLENIKKATEEEHGERFKVTFFLENKERENKDMTKKQYINTLGSCCWSDDPNNLPEWFASRTYRVAFVGEEDLFSFLRTWLGNLDYRKPATTLELDWKKLMKGNVSEIREQIKGEWVTNIVALATVTTKEKDGEVKEYQTIYNRKFLPPYTMKNFRLIDYLNEDILLGLKKKKSSDLKPHERFVLDITDSEYGSKDYFILKDLQKYNAEDNIVSTDKVITKEGADY
jgi:hypothetical protein